MTSFAEIYGAYAKDVFNFAGRHRKDQFGRTFGVRRQRATEEDKTIVLDFWRRARMSGFSAIEWVARTPKDVFDFIAASENAPKIVNSVTSMIKLTESPPRVGTRYRETRFMNGKEQQAELEIVEFEPARKYAVQNITSGIETIYRYNLQPERDGTRIDLVCEVKARGIKKLILPLVAAFLKKEDGDHLQRVKKLLEG